MKIFRSTLVAVVATVVAACGDKVNVQAPVNTTTTVTSTATATATATPKVNSVTVTPATATLTVGQTITLTAAVNADAGLATTVTWSTSDATLATVSTAGVVTAVKATPGVSICATSTVDTGKKGCGAVVITAASATVPATASIAGVFQTNLTTPVTPSSVSGTIFAQVNINPGTQVVQRVVLLVGSVRADSQVFSAAQSAALRYAADLAGVSKDVSQPTVVLTANTAAYNATTGVATFTNAAGQSIKAELWVTGATTATSTASYASSITLNNTDAVYGAWTNPSTVVNATDNLGYQWQGLGGGVYSLKVTPVSYNGKTASSVSVAFGSTVSATVGYINATSAYCPVTPSTSCVALPSGKDTALTKVVTGSAPYTATFGLFDHAFVAGSTTNKIADGIAPTVTVNFTDGSSIAGAAFANATALAIRPDNQGPAQPAMSNPAFNASISVMRGVVSFASRPTLTSLSAVADSGKLINTVPADIGVSSGATLTVPNGMTFKAFRNAGGTAVSATDTLLATTEIAAGTSLSTLAETGSYCLQLRAYDALGNVSVNNQDSFVNAAGTIVAKGCTTATGQQVASIDNTAPVFTWQSTNFTQTDTAVASVAQDADLKWTLTEANSSGTISVKVCYYSTSGNAVVPANYNSLATTTTTACDTYVTYATYSGVANGISTAAVKWAQAAITANGVYKIDVKTTDAAGFASAVLTKYVLVDNVAPTVSTPTSVSTTLGATQAPAGYISDLVDVRANALTMTGVGYTSGAGFLTLPVTQSTSTRIAAVLEEAPTVLNTSIGVPVASRFFNVAVSGSTANEYLYPLAANGDTLALNNVHSTTSGNSGDDGLGLINGFRTKFAFRGYDQVGNNALSSYAASTIIDSVSTFGTASRFALVGNGLINASDVTTADAGTTGALASSVVKVATTDAAATANAGYTRTKALRVDIKMFRYQDKTGHMVRALAYKQANNYCGTNASTGVTYVIAADGTTESVMAAGSQITSTRVPASNVAPTVMVYAPLVGGASWGYVGTMSNSNTVGNANTSGFCDDTDTRTYTMTWSVSARTPATNWSNGQLLFVIQGASGQAAVKAGPFVDLK